MTTFSKTVLAGAAGLALTATNPAQAVQQGGAGGSAATCFETMSWGSCPDGSAGWEIFETGYVNGVVGLKQEVDCVDDPGDGSSLDSAISLELSDSNSDQCTDLNSDGGPKVSVDGLPDPSGLVPQYGPLDGFFTPEGSPIQGGAVWLAK